MKRSHLNKYLLALLYIISPLINSCTNIDLLEKLENPGNRERFTTNNYIFISSWMVQGDIAFTPFSECSGMTGVMNADCSCTRAAAANGLRKSASHQFIAVLSTGAPSIYDAVCKIQGLPQIGCTPTDAVPWFNTKGEQVAMSTGSLFGANTIAIQYTENGSVPDTMLGWSGSNTSGVNSTFNCDNWSSKLSGPTGTAGNRNGLSGQWLSDGSAPFCDTTQRLYCASRL